MDEANFFTPPPTTMSPNDAIRFLTQLAAAEMPPKLCLSAKNEAAPLQTQPVECRYNIEMGGRLIDLPATLKTTEGVYATKSH